MASSSVERGQDGGQAAGEHRLARARRADHQDVVAAGGGDLERALGVSVAAHVARSRRRRRRGTARQAPASAAGRIDVALAVQVLDGVVDGAHRDDVDACDDGGLGRVVGGHEERPRRRCARQCSATGSTPRTGRTRAVERQLAEDDATRSRSPGLTTPVAPRMPSAIGRSKAAPSLRRSAGARLTVMRSTGKSKPAFRMAARTRSRLSRTVESGSPTVVKDGSPEVTSTSTRRWRPRCREGWPSGRWPAWRECEQRKTGRQRVETDTPAVERDSLPAPRRRLGEGLDGGRLLPSAGNREW